MAKKPKSPKVRRGGKKPRRRGKKKRNPVSRALRKTGRALKRIGRVTWKGVRVVAPIAEAVLPGGSLVRATIRAITTAEKEFGPGRGRQKKQRATEIVIGALAAAELATGRELFDQQKLGRVLGPLIDLLITRLNSQAKKK